MFFRMVYKSGQIFYRFVTIHACDRQTDWTDRRTDRILIARPRLHCMQRGKNYKNRLRLAKDIVKNKMSRFLWYTVYMLTFTHYYALHLHR